MPIFITERTLPNIAPEQFDTLRKTEIEICDHFTAEGKPVRYLRSSWVPSESHMLCLFEAANAQLVRDVNEAAGLTFTRIVEAIELSP